MRLTTSLFRRRTLLAAPVAVLDYGDRVPPMRTQPLTGIKADPCCDDQLAYSELQGQLARTQSACLRLAQQLEARYVRYAWTEQLARELRAIAHGTVGR